jgi:hypothetical protein
MNYRIRKTQHKFFWLEECKDDGAWLIIDSFRTKSEAQMATTRERHEPSWVRHTGHKNRVSWVFKGDWRLSIWHHQIMRDKPFVVLENHKEISRWPTLNQARIALLVRRTELQ